MRAIRYTQELRRILNIPRRSLDDEPAYIDEMTRVLKTPNGQQRLREVQARALMEAARHRALVGAIGVGEGKTIISLLLAYVLDAQRPVLLAPAALIQKTRRDISELSRHWRIPSQLRLLSYEMLSRKQSALTLHDWQPDFIVADEAHRLKNRKAAVTRRVDRWLRDSPETIFVPLTGTLMSDSLIDYWHLLVWALRDRAPVPLELSEAEEWALALDRDVPEEARFEVGELSRLIDAVDRDESTDPLTDVRKAYQRRIFETPGVIRALKGETVGASIYVRGLVYEMSRVTDNHVARLRSEMVTPDDWDLMTGAEVWLHARQLALGFHSIWNPRPPREWRDARRNWAAFVRDYLSRARKLDSPEQVYDACEAGELFSDAFEPWKAVRDTYKPTVEYVWHDDSALRWIMQWMKEAPGIVWVEHIAVGQALEKLTGSKYYGGHGLSRDGSFIDDADPRDYVIASVAANKEGRNLQKKWNRNLITSPMSSAKDLQQLLARTHRTGQVKDEVIVDMMLGCIEHYLACQTAREAAEVIQHMSGETQRILLADVIEWPTEADVAQLENTSARWKSSLDYRG